MLKSNTRPPEEDRIAHEIPDPPPEKDRGLRAPGPTESSAFTVKQGDSHAESTGVVEDTQS
ncbi:hypothetical protein LZ198_14640 [Myxococcus sp. K15C18031901]|uniref:hypothetical protein n=1 Tax=Myxococcus dinghuensis TaxID=2906761 RepID=UPI0020A74291|nr:hypothetical protein [Myxococcus dinghuensis]MCP3100111.1 hypothetical protein [Myxococcus dinghuensis]